MMHLYIKIICLFYIRAPTWVVFKFFSNFRSFQEIHLEMKMTKKKMAEVDMDLMEMGMPGIHD